MDVFTVLFLEIDWMESTLKIEYVCLLSEGPTLFFEDLILVQDERWRRG